MDLTNELTGIVAVIVFILAYVLVIGEEYTHLRKSKPVMLAAGIIWAFIGWRYSRAGIGPEAEEAINGFLLEYAELFLFLLAAMTYVNAMSERNVFNALRDWLVRRDFTYRSLFWITGTLSFLLSPMIDNLTTALVMCAVVLAVGHDNKRFIGAACCNIVVGANAGGAFSPFGDITTLMVWQRGLVEFQSFFALFLPALINYVVPAALMSLAVPKDKTTHTAAPVKLKRGAKRIIFLFACTVTTAVTFHNFLDLPAFLGMMTGLAYLKFFGYYLKKTHVVTPPIRPTTARPATSRPSIPSARLRGSSGIPFCSSSA